MKKLNNNKLENISSSWVIIVALVSAYICIFKTNYKNNPADIPFLSVGIAIIILPLCYFVVQKIQLCLIKNGFYEDEHIICASIIDYPKWCLYLMLPAFIGTCVGAVITIILHPEIYFRRINSENINFAIVVTFALLYFLYYLVLRVKTVLTNYGLRSNYKYDTLFEDVEKIEEENVSSIKFLKIYKHHNSQTNKIPKIYKPSNDRIDNITGSIMQNYKETKAAILKAYEAYKVRRKK